jgi:copper chaperone NosL
MMRRAIGRGRPALARALACAVVLAAEACGGTGPRPVVLGEDSCSHCRMEVSDARFATEAVTRTGRVNVFDSIDCLANYVRGAEPGSLATVWVTDFDRPGTFVDAARAGFLVGSSVQGPMGSTLAFASPTAARAAQARFGGTPKDWGALLDATTEHASGAH